MKMGDVCPWKRHAKSAGSPIQDCCSSRAANRRRRHMRPRGRGSAAAPRRRSHCSNRGAHIVTRARVAATRPRRRDACRPSQLTWRRHATPAYLAAPRSVPPPASLPGGATPRQFTWRPPASLPGGATPRQLTWRRHAASGVYEPWKLREGQLRDRCAGGPAGKVVAPQLVCHNEAVPPLHESRRGASHRHAAAAASVMMEACYVLVPLLAVPRLSGAATAWVTPGCA